MKREVCYRIIVGNKYIQIRQSAEHSTDYQGPSAQLPAEGDMRKRSAQRNLRNRIHLLPAGEPSSGKVHCLYHARCALRAPALLSSSLNC